jgi:hypothetical protein
MTYRLAQRWPESLPAWWSEPAVDSLFDGDRHGDCSPDGRNLCDRAYFTIERIIEPLEAVSA